MQWTMLLKVLKSNYKEVIGIIIMLIAIFLCLNNTYKRGYASGVNDTKVEVTKMQEKLQEAQEQALKQMVDEQNKINEHSRQYEERKVERELEERVRYVTVQKIIEKPIYHNECIDTDGLSELNDAINEANRTK